MHSWLPADLDPRVRTAIELALADVGEHEIPPGSNRGPVPDRVNGEFGSPLGSFWCGNFIGHVWKSAGLRLPAVPGVVDNWRRWALQTGRWLHGPTWGAAALFGEPTHASHIAMVVCLSPLLVVGGNQSWDGYSRNGEAVTLRRLDADRLVGYVAPLLPPTMAP